ncbi:hypothetical protein MNEG_11147 [Monoraphidium neglectum]|uniref:Uncharacterized protein n=1 Tax=Monoraphidium neglectum TaxID=145388 RepID=A0A0D2JAQ7_9CHLO|nr:hypothetical protein MNEG_11147 [Monoraphidium neglectum]KIY96817.1 hypothetical protein MNEG_11147 [Monoraphidium neglectum]|eukprot:XP_013895837.1 hypothetical protein MNEG_11147 [Monoraphidium neglectum]
MNVQAFGKARAFTAARSQKRSCVRTRVVVKADAETATKGGRKLGPLERGGTLSGADAAGKDAGERAKQMMAGEAKAGEFLQIRDGRFVDDRWEGGRWNLSKFANAAGETDWDKVIDAEMARRKLLEDSPIPSTNEDAVIFDTAEIPWWAWVRRFHLPEAEKLNGRAAMVGYFAALAVDQLTGAGLLDQQNSFLGKVLLHVAVFGILIIRTTSDLGKYKNLIDEATFYDSQWNAAWVGVQRPSEKEQ